MASAQETVKENMKPEVVDAQVQKTVEAVKQSSVGKKIPTRLMNVGPRDLLRFALITKVLWMVPVYLLTAIVPAMKLAGLRLGNIFRYAYVIVLVLDSAVAGIIYLFALNEQYYISAVASGCKIIVVGLWVGACVVTSWSFFTFIVYLCFIAEMFIIDGLFLYYLSFVFQSENVDQDAANENQV